MTTTENRSFSPSQARNGLLKLIIILAAFFLVSCSHTAPVQTSGAAGSQKKPETARKARGAEPQPGDIKVVDGVEYIYGRNARFGSTPLELEYDWVRRDQYSPGWDYQERAASAGMSAKELKDMQELEDRIAKLEAQLKGAPQPASRPKSVSKAPVTDETGKKWTSFWKGDNGVEWFYDKEDLVQPRKGLIQVWKKRVFPSGSAQKEIVTHDEISCRQAQWRTLELRVTGWDGTIQSSNKPSPWGNINSGRPEEYLMEEHCKQ
jgi:hypothetical protein